MNIKLNKKLLFNTIFVAFLVIIFVIPFMGDELYVGHDCRFHMYRLVGIVESLQDHQFPPKIYPYTNNGYGYASPLFYCDLFLYPFAILYYLGLPLAISYKLMLGFYIFLTIVIVFYVSNKVCKKNITPYFATIIYSFANYRLYDLYIRSAIGEVFAFAFIPLVFYAIYKIFFERRNTYILLGVSFSLLLMSHNISFVLSCVVFGIFIIIFFIKNRKDIKLIKNISINISKGIVVALLLSGWYLFPMLEQMLDQEFWVNNLSEMYQLERSLVPLSAIISPFAISDKLDVVSIHNVINIGTILTFMPLAYFLLNKRNKNIYIVMLIVISYILLFSMCGIIPLYKIEALRFMQFMFRFYIVIYPILCVVCIYIFDKIESKKLKLIFIVFILIYSSLNIYIINNTASKNNPNMYIRDDISREELYDFEKEIKYRDHNGLEISGGEYLPTTELVDYLEETTFIKEVKNDGYVDIIYDFDRSFSKIVFTYDNQEGNKLIMLPQSYYKGYQVYEVVDDKKIPIETINIQRYKKVGFYVEPGLHTYYCQYEGTIVQKVTFIISLITFIYIIFIKFKHKRIES